MAFFKKLFIKKESKIKYHKAKEEKTPKEIMDEILNNHEKVENNCYAIGVYDFGIQFIDNDNLILKIVAIRSKKNKITDSEVIKRYNKQIFENENGKYTNIANFKYCYKLIGLAQMAMMV